MWDMRLAGVSIVGLFQRHLISICMSLLRGMVSITIQSIDYSAVNIQSSQCIAQDGWNAECNVQDSGLRVIN